MAMTYLERYRNGEHEVVWAELVALGPAIRDGPLVEDAQAVAWETMPRARTNVALRYALRLAPDTILTAGESGGDPTEVYFPDPAIDAPLRGDWEGTPFVTYLRTCFAWDGFPGLREAQDPPREDLAFLTQGLLPL